MLPPLARSTRLITATVVVLAALACFAGSAGAVKDCGNKLCVELTRSPASGVVSTGGIATYTVNVTSFSTSTATKVMLTMTFPDGSTLLRQQGPRTCAKVPSADPNNVVYACDLGSVKPSAVLDPFAFDVQLGGSGAAPTTAEISADARNSDKPGSDPTIEDFSVTDEVSVDPTDGKASSAVPKGLKFTLDTDINHSGANDVDDRRTSIFTIAANSFLTTAVIDDEVPDPGFVCPTSLKCPNGGWTEAIIPGPGGPIFTPPGFGPFMSPNELHVQMVYDASTLPPGMTTQKYVLIHDRDYDPNTRVYEFVSQRCQGANPKPSCLEDVHFLDNGDLYVKALVDGNFRYR